MKPMAIEDVSEIINIFDLEEISELLRKQVELGNGVSQTTDYFRPLYIRYRAIMDSEDNPGDVKDIATEKFTEVCTLFLNILCEKFELNIDETWVEDNEDQLPGLVVALYCFFVKDLIVNLQEIFINYIKQHKERIYEVFEDRKNKKDAATLINKRNYTVELAVVLANIYDTTSWALQQITEESLTNYLNEDYAPLSVFQDLFDEGIITGDYMEVIREIYETGFGLKSEVCLGVLSSFSNNQERK